jgi:hypothetical protein
MIKAMVFTGSADFLFDIELSMCARLSDSVVVLD